MLARLGTLGDVTLRLTRVDPSISFPTRKANALFVFLALTGVKVRRDVLCALLWGDVPNAQARHSLRQAISQIRAALRPFDERLLLIDRDTVALDPKRLRVDLHCVERLLKRGTPSALRMSCALARGEFMPGGDIKEAGFERWLTFERLRTRQLAIEAHERCIKHLQRTSEDTEALLLALRLVAIDPLHEWGHRTVMTLLKKHHQITAALRQYDICASILARELGVEPDLETQALRAELMRDRSRPPAMRPTPEPIARAAAMSPTGDGKFDYSISSDPLHRALREVVLLTQQASQIPVRRQVRGRAGVQMRSPVNKSYK